MRPQRGRDVNARDIWNGQVRGDEELLARISEATGERVEVPSIVTAIDWYLDALFGEDHAESQTGAA